DKHSLVGDGVKRPALPPTLVDEATPDHVLPKTRNGIAHRSGKTNPPDPPLATRPATMIPANRRAKPPHMTLKGTRKMSARDSKIEGSGWPTQRMRSPLRSSPWRRCLTLKSSID